MPRPDSALVFGRLLDPDGGYFSIEPAAGGKGNAHYLPNTNVLVNAYCITDFCPRFEQYGRMYRPIAVFRIVEPLHGTPVVKVACRVVTGWDKHAVRPVRGNSHLRFEIGADHLRLTTNMPLTYLCEETPFALQQPLFFALRKRRLNQSVRAEPVEAVAHLLIRRERISTARQARSSI